MSKNNIQNRDHYMIAGRERPGKAEAQVNPRVTNQAQEGRERWEQKKEKKGRGKK